MKKLQKWFYKPYFSYAVTTHTAQWRSTTTDITTKIMTEMTTETKKETTTTMPLPDQEPMVQSLIRSQQLGLV